MEKLTDKQQLRKEYAVKTVFNSFFAGIAFTSDLNLTVMQNMMDDSDIKSGITSLKMALLRRNFQVKSKSGKDTTEINKKFNSEIINYNVINNIIDSKYYGYTVQEIMYNDDYSIKEIKNKPREWFTTLYDTTDKKYKWYFSETAAVNTANELPYAKFIVSINEFIETHPAGKSELKPLYKYWKIKSSALDYATEIMQKYGGVITWFIYNEDTSEAELQEMVDGLKNVQNGSAIPIPGKPNSPQQGLGKEFGFINTSELTSDIHERMIMFCKNQITEYLLGNSLIQRQDGAGSYASTQTANDIRGEYADSLSLYVIDSLNILFEYDTAINGWDNSDYYFELSEPENEIYKEDLSSKKLDNYKKIKEIGYKVSKEYVSQQTGIPEEYLEDMPEMPNIPTFGATVNEFAKKESLAEKKKRKFRANSKYFWDAILNNKSIVKAMSKEYMKSIESIKDETDIANITAKLTDTELDEFIYISRLKGYYDILEENNKASEFEEINGITYDSVFDMPFQEAVSFMTNKYPVLYEYLDDVSQEAAQQIFWVQKATDKMAVEKFQKSLQKTLKSGETFDKWLENIRDIADKQGFGEDGYYLNNVFRTNALSSYNAGRYEQQNISKDIMPYWMYDAIDDDRTSDICRELNGKILKADDPTWNTIYPPNHFQCRSGVISLDKEEFADAKENIEGTQYISDGQKNYDIISTMEKLNVNGFNSTPTAKFEV